MWRIFLLLLFYEQGRKLGVTYNYKNCTTLLIRGQRTSSTLIICITYSSSNVIFTDKKIFITGGTSGIGRALVSEFVQRGATHIAVMARRSDRTESLAQEYPQVNFIKISGDVSVVEDLQRAVSTLQDQWGILDILINNAGVVSAGPLEDISDEDIVQQININLTGLVILTKYAMPLLKKSSEGAIMNVSSGLGLIGMPFYSVYASTKAAVRQFSDALRREYYQYPLHVMTVYPTATDTPMMENTSASGMDSPETVAHESVEGLINQEINVIFGGEQRIKDHQMNFESPQEFDKKIAGAYDSLKKRSTEHRAM